MARPKIDNPMAPLERKRKQRQREADEKLARIAVLDLETDPFDKGCEVHPFVGELYFGPDVEPIIIWEDDREKFISQLYDTIEALPDRYTIYAHNGGRFDFKFLLHKIRGEVKFKGNGIMQCHIGAHELRDSFDIIPAPLAAYKKDEFDYTKLKQHKRHKYRHEILDYLHADCVYLREVIIDFIKRYGHTLTMGTAAFKALKKVHKVASLSMHHDDYLRDYFFGGRVECLQGAGHFVGDYKLYDVNSMYPYVMAYFDHPIDTNFNICNRITDDTVFLRIECDNYGAFVGRDENGSLTPNISRGIFNTTIHEYRAAMELGLIANARLHHCIEFARQENFADFILPLYDERQNKKIALKNDEDTSQLKRDILLLKLLMNSTYGKFAQNPRKFKDHFYADFNEAPPGDIIGPFQVAADDDSGIWEKHSDYIDYDNPANSFTIWEKVICQDDMRFNNVATAASITGAARATLMRAIHAAHDPIYCDTDSIICQHLPMAADDSDALGDWTREETIAECLIAGKKLYGYDGPFLDEPKIKAKGASDLTWQEMQKIIDGVTVDSVKRAPTISRTGVQQPMRREIKLTCEPGYKSRILNGR